MKTLCLVVMLACLGCSIFYSFLDKELDSIHFLLFAVLFNQYRIQSPTQWH